MQPYFLPYIGYFSLANEADHFILLDTVQYIRHGWINRNRILKPNGIEDQYITIPLQKHSRSTLIKDIKIKGDSAVWKKRIISQLSHYKKKADNFHAVMSLLNDLFRFDTDSITLFNYHLFKGICNYLEIDCKLSIFSEMNLTIDTVNHSGQWALNICKAIDCDNYVNPIGGSDIFLKEEFYDNNISLSFIDSNLIDYTNNGKFISGLSIVDVLMFNSISETKNMIANYKILK